MTLIAGLGAGLVLTAWSSARRSGSSFDRFLAGGIGALQGWWATHRRPAEDLHVE